MADPAALLADLAAESADLDTHVSTMDADRWGVETPAPGWTIAHQIGHLAWTDRMALLAATDPAAFQSQLAAAMANPDGYTERAAEDGARQRPADLLRQWRDGRAELAQALAAVPAGQKLPWFGPPMGAASMVTARLMETWAHGQDVVDTLGVTRTPTARLRHVTHIGVRTVGFAFLVNDKPAPTAEFRVELTAPDGTAWIWGPAESTERISGPALDFCLLVTQRRNPADLAIRAEGEQARAWLPIAQAFAGPPGSGRAKGQFA